MNKLLTLVVLGVVALTAIPAWGQFDVLPDGASMGGAYLLGGKTIGIATLDKQIGSLKGNPIAINAVFTKRSLSDSTWQVNGGASIALTDVVKRMKFGVAYIWDGYESGLALKDSWKNIATTACFEVFAQPTKSAFVETKNYESLNVGLVDGLVGLKYQRVF